MSTLEQRMDAQRSDAHDLLMIVAGAATRSLQIAEDRIAALEAEAGLLRMRLRDAERLAQVYEQEQQRAVSALNEWKRNVR